MFGHASSFNQDLSWCVDNDVNLDGAFSGSGCCSMSYGVAQKDETGDCQIKISRAATTTTKKTTMTTMGPRSSSCQRDSRRLEHVHGDHHCGDRECGPGTMRPGPHDRLRSRHDAPALHLTRVCHHRDQDLRFEEDRARRLAAQGARRKGCEPRPPPGKLALKHARGRRARCKRRSPTLPPPHRPALPNRL